MARETILIDADDTLWENNVYFEQTIEEFLTLLAPFGYPRRICPPHPERNRET